MKLYTLGPVEMHPTTIAAGAYHLPYFRTETWSNWLLQLEEKMRPLFGASQMHRILMMSASGTGGMEAALRSTFIPGQDKLLIISCGSFGERFAHIATSMGLEHVIHHLEEEIPLTEEILDAYKQKGFTGITVTHCETSNGKVTDLSIVSEFAQTQNLLTVVDAVSSFICEPINMMELNLDIVITASQKALACAPGIAPIALSPRAIERIKYAKSLKMNHYPFYLDLAQAIDNAIRGQTTYTPALAVLNQIDQRLEMLSHNIDEERAHIQQVALAFREHLDEFEHVTHPNWSNGYGLTLLQSDRYPMYQIFTSMQEEGIYITPCSGVHRPNRLRIGHMGALATEDSHHLASQLIKQFQHYV